MDTDHISVLQRTAGSEYERLVRRIDAIGPTAMFASIISFHEQVAIANQMTLLSRNQTDFSNVPNLDVED